MRERYEAKAVMEMLQQCWKGSSSCSEANQYRKAFSNKWKVEWTSSTPRVVFDDPSGFIPPYWAKTSGKADETDAAEFDAIGDTVLPLAVGRDVAEDPAAFMRIAEADNDATEMTGGAVGAAAEAEATKGEAGSGSGTRLRRSSAPTRGRCRRWNCTAPAA